MRDRTWRNFKLHRHRPKESNSSILPTLQTKRGWFEKGRISLKRRVIRLFQNHRVGVCDSAECAGFVEESSRRSRARRKSSKDKWGCRILRCGRFPSGFPGNTRDVWRTCRGDMVARIREREREPHVSIARPRLYGLSVQDAIPNAVISGKAAAQRRATCDNEDCGGERHAWDGTVGYSAPLSRDSLLGACSGDRVISIILLKCIRQFSIFRL